MLALAVAFLGYGLPLDPSRRAHMRASPLRTPKSLSTRRAPLAEHGWEQRLLRNLTQSD